MSQTLARIDRAGTQRLHAFPRNTLLLLPLLLAGCLGSSGNGVWDDEDSSDDRNPSAGVPDPDSFSIAADQLTVDTAADLVNVENEFTVKFADNLNNLLAADGTMVFFTTEGGTIPAFCETVDGQCRVTWSSGEPYPADNRVNMLAWTRGSESYVDLNSNGFFDDGDLQMADMAEPFRDDNENGVRDSDELFVEFPSGVTVSSGADADYDGPDGRYSGPDCAHSTACAGHQSVFLYRHFTIVLGTARNAGTVAFTDCAGNPVAGPLGPGQHCALVTDSAGNPMPDASSITFSANAIQVDGPAATAATTSPAGSRITFDLIADGTPGAGTLKLTVQSSGGARASGQIATAD